MPSHKLLARTALVCAVALIAAGCGRTTHHASKSPAVKPSPSAQLHGLVPTPLPTVPTFTLTDTEGRPFAFAAHARGKLTYLYFGYTHCPDVCPLTMATIAAALRTVSPAVRAKVQVVFVQRRSKTRHQQQASRLAQPLQPVLCRSHRHRTADPCRSPRHWYPAPAASEAHGRLLQPRSQRLRVALQPRWARPRHLRPGLHRRRLRPRHADPAPHLNTPDS